MLQPGLFCQVSQRLQEICHKVWGDQTQGASTEVNKEKRDHDKEEKAPGRGSLFSRTGPRVPRCPAFRFLGALLFFGFLLILVLGVVFAEIIYLGNPCAGNPNRLAYAVFAKIEMKPLFANTNTCPTFTDVYFYAREKSKALSKTERHRSSFVTIELE